MMYFAAYYGSSGHTQKPSHDSSASHQVPPQNQHSMPPSIIVNPEPVILATDISLKTYLVSVVGSFLLSVATDLLMEASWSI